MDMRFIPWFKRHKGKNLIVGTLIGSIMCALPAFFKSLGLAFSIIGSINLLVALIVFATWRLDIAFYKELGK